MSDNQTVSEDRVRLIAKEEAERERNQAMGVFTLIGLLLGLLAYVGIEVSVSEAMDDSAVEAARGDVAEARDRVLAIAAEVEEAYDTFRNADGFMGLASEVRGLSGRLDGEAAQCRTVSAQGVRGENTCFDHANFLGAAACGKGEFISSIRVNAVRDGGGFMCFFVAECCGL